MTLLVKTETARAHGESHGVSDGQSAGRLCFVPNNSLLDEQKELWKERGEGLQSPRKGSGAGGVVSGGALARVRPWVPSPAPQE